MTTFETIAVAGLDDDDQATLNRLLRKLEQQSRRNLLRSSYYDGRRAIRQVGTVIPPQYFNLGIVLGWSAKAVDALARRCNLDGFVWADGTLDDLGYSEFVEDNQLLAEMKAAMVSSLVFGPAFLINGVGAEGEPPSLLHVKDALSATGDWNTRRRTLDNLVSITGRDEDGNLTAVVLYLDGVTMPIERVEGRWVLVDRVEHNLGVPVEALVYKPAPWRPFGASRISRTVMSLHDQALRTVVRMEGHADIYSYPELWLLGADESIFTKADGSRSAAWQVMLGRIKAIPDDDDAAEPRADVKQFRASSPEPHIMQLKQQAQLFAGETSIPLTSLGVSDQSNPVSADSYVASREDLIAEAEGTTDDWSLPIRRATVRGLQIANGLDEVPESWRSIAPKWRSPVYLSKAAEADAGAKQLGAVPWLAETAVGLELLGLTPQQIESAMAERRRLNGSASLAAIRRAREAGELVVTGAADRTVQG